MCLMLCYQGLHAAPDKKDPPAKIKDNPTTLIEYLAQEKNLLNIDINNAKQYIAPKDKQEFDQRIERINSSLSIIDAKIESLNSFLDNEKKQSVDLNQKLKYLQQLPLNNDEINIQERVARTDTLLTVSNKTLELINENINLAQQLKVELSEETKKLKAWQDQFDLDQIGRAHV